MSRRSCKRFQVQIYVPLIERKSDSSTRVALRPTCSSRSMLETLSTAAAVTVVDDLSGGETEASGGMIISRVGRRSSRAKADQGQTARPKRGKRGMKRNFKKQTASKELLGSLMQESGERSYFVDLPYTDE